MDSDKVICSRGEECSDKGCGHNIPHLFSDERDSCSEAVCNKTKWWVVCKRSPVYVYTKIVKEFKHGLQAEDHRQG